MQSLRFTFGLLLIVVCQVASLADDANSTPSSAPGKFDGHWLFESATLRNKSQLEQVWSSVVSISGEQFSVPNFLDPSKELRGKLRFDEKDGNALDLSLEELDFASLGEPVKIPTSTLKGIVNVENENAITIALYLEPSALRPAKFKSSDSVFLIRLLRAPKDFTEYPKEIKISVTSVDGKPVEGAIAAVFQSKLLKPDQEEAQWEYFEKTTTDTNGIVQCPYNRLPKIVRDEKSKQVAFPELSPPALACGELHVKLEPECCLQATAVCEELAKAGRPLGRTGMYLERNGVSIAFSMSESGSFDFIVPPGKYQLAAYGSELHRRTVNVSVPAGRPNFTAEPVALKLSAFAFLKGKPAPEFTDVAGWSGEPITLSSLKGKYVLIDFWGYWCGPCVGAMPVLIELHEKFRDKGLAIVGVHVDAEDNVDTAEKLREKLAIVVNEQWNGKEIPFSNALVSGKVEGEGENRRQTGTPDTYGVLMYPTTILIDPEGKVVEEFHARDIKAATERIEKLLESRK